MYILSLLASLAVGQGTSGITDIPDAAPIPYTVANSGFIREGNVMRERMYVPEVPLLYSFIELDARAVVGQGVVIGQATANRLSTLQAMNPWNPDILSMLLCWVIAHEYAHFFTYKYMMGVKDLVPSSTDSKNRVVNEYLRRPKYWETMADTLAAYYCGARIKEQLQEQLVDPDSMYGILRLDSCQLTLQLYALDIGQPVLFGAQTHPTKLQRNYASKEGFDNGREWAFGKDFKLFRGGDDDKSRAAKKWLEESVNAALRQ